MHMRATLALWPLSSSTTNTLAHLALTSDGDEADGENTGWFYRDWVHGHVFKTAYSTSQLVYRNVTNVQKHTSHPVPQIPSVVPLITAPRLGWHEKKASRDTCLRRPHAPLPYSRCTFTADLPSRMTAVHYMSSWSRWLTITGSASSKLCIIFIWR